MNKQTYKTLAWMLRERARSLTHISHFPVSQRDIGHRLLALRDKADMLQCRADMAQSGSYTLRMRLTYCAPQRVLDLWYGVGMARPSGRIPRTQNSGRSEK